MKDREEGVSSCQFENNERGLCENEDDNEGEELAHLRLDTVLDSILALLSLEV